MSLQFSANFELKSEEEKVWFTKKLEGKSTETDEDEEEEEEEEEEENQSLDLSWSISGSFLYLEYDSYSEQDTLEKLAKIFFEFFNLFRSKNNDVFTLTWSDDSYYSGGIMFVCKDYFLVQSDDEIIEKTINNYLNGIQK